MRIIHSLTKIPWLCDRLGCRGYPILKRYVIFYNKPFSLQGSLFEGVSSYKQHEWGPPPLNHRWKFKLWLLQTEIRKINAGFALHFLFSKFVKFCQNNGLLGQKPQTNITRTQFCWQPPSDYFHFFRHFLAKPTFILRISVCKGHWLNFQLWFRGGSHACCS